MVTPEPTTYAQAILFALNRKLGPLIYQGTVPGKVRAERRRKNKVAKQSRKANR